MTQQLERAFAVGRTLCVWTKLGDNSGQNHSGVSKSYFSEQLMMMVVRRCCNGPPHYHDEKCVYFRFQNLEDAITLFVNIMCHMSLDCSLFLESKRVAIWLTITCLCNLELVILSLFWPSNFQQKPEKDLVSTKALWNLQLMNIRILIILRCPVAQKSGLAFPWKLITFSSSRIVGPTLFPFKSHIIFA